MPSANVCTLTCASVNSGTAVVLDSASVKYAWKNNIRVDPIASSYALTEIEHRGWENPKFIVRGVIDSAAGANHITEQLLKEFAKIKNETITLIVKYGDIGNETTFTNSAGSLSNSGISVIVDDFNIDINPGSIERAHLLPYTLILVEDKV